MDWFCDKCRCIAKFHFASRAFLFLLVIKLNESLVLIPDPGRAAINQGKGKTEMRSQTMFTLLFILGVSACASPTQPPSLTPVIVQLSFSHQAEFAGLYAADQLGLFKQEDLQVKFQEGGPQVDFIAPVANGTAQFGVAQPADVILARADGKPIRSIATIYRRSPIVFFALADSGITRPQDFIGKKIRSTLTVDQTLRALMTRVGVRSDQYQIVYLPSDVSLFASREAAVWAGFINVFALEVQRAGYKLNFIFPDDYGIHFYGDVLITTDDLITKNADLVSRFTRAALKGWTYAIENPTTIGTFVQKYNPNADAALENARMTASLPLVNTGEDHIGWMKPEIWTGMEKTLREQGVLTKTVTITNVYTMQFLNEIYPSQ